MTVRTRAGIVLGLALALFAASASVEGRDDKKPRKPTEKRLSDGERHEILELIKLVDRARIGQVPVKQARPWERYTFKANEGMGYLPFVMDFDAEPDAFRSVAMYVRVALRRSDGSDGAERSGLEQWLNQDALKGIPRPMRGFVYVNPDEMPTGGPAAGSRRAVVNSAQGSTTALTLLAKERQEDESKDDRGEGHDKKNDADPFLYPFEDFGFLDLATTSQMAQPGSRRIDRAVALPAGAYDMYLAVRERPGPGKNPPPPRVAIYRQPLDVPDLSSGFSLSSIIVADHLGLLSVPYDPEQQSAHPFALGWTEATPAADRRFSDTEQLGIVFQVLNATPDPRRKPDVTVEYTFFRQAGNGETKVTAARQDYNRTTLPPEFDLLAGHQLLAAQAVPLKAFPPGDYRLELDVTDRRASKSVKTDVAFTVVASPGSLWVSRTVQALLAPPFRREDALRPEVLDPSLRALESYQSMEDSATLTSAIASAHDGQFASLLNQVTALDGHEPAAAFLRGVALLGLNGGPEAATRQFRAAVSRGPEFWPAGLYLGISEAAQGRDREAIEAWTPGLHQGGSDASFLQSLVADAQLRLNDVPQAVALLEDAHVRWPDDDVIAKRLAAAQILARDCAAAFTGLEQYLARHGDDVDALFLALHLLHQSRVGGPELGGRVDVPDKLPIYAKAYVRANGPHQVVVAQWLSELVGGVQSVSDSR